MFMVIEWLFWGRRLSEGYTVIWCNGTQGCALVYGWVCHPFRVDSITEVRREADRNRSEEPDSLCPTLWETVSFTLSFHSLPPY